MFKNYFKIAVRRFFNQKYYSIINTLGLALGTGACILILLFVQDELSYESSFENNELIYRLVEDFPMGTHLSQSATVPFPTKNTMITDFPEITNAALIFRPSGWGNSPVIKLGSEDFFEDDFIYAEPSLLDIYNFNFIRGTKKDALRGPNQIILTQSKAKLYFGDEDPLGKHISLNGFRELEVVGVIEDLPANTHLKISLIRSFETYRSFFNNPQFFDTQWVWVAAYLYFTVPSEAAAKKIEAGLPDYVLRHYPENLTSNGIALRLQKANDIHLTSNLELEFKSNGNIQHVYLFSFIAFLILIIAIINFMNLSTSRSIKRAKEVGMRKVMGAHRSMLVSQFMGEAVLTSLISLVIAVLLIVLALPWFNDLTGKSFDLSLLKNPMIIGGIVLLTSITGLLAGSYPALILASFQPTDVLKGNSGNMGSSNFLRKILVVSQFVISISLIICIGIVFKQLDYIHNKDMGFNKGQVLTVDVTFNIQQKYGGLKSELLKNHEILSVSMLGGSIPGNEEVIENSFVETNQPPEKQQWFSVMFARYDFEKVLDVEFLQGHSFQIGNSQDSVGFIINESAAAALGWGKDVLGKKLDRLGNSNVIQSGTVIGLLKDFHYRPLYDPIKPLVIQLGGNTLVIKIQSQDLQQTISTIEQEWNAQFDGNPFRYSFMDDNFARLYRKEDKFSRTIEYFSGLAIFIACLGLLGLSSYTTEMRRKEIGIRKVNGASTLGLIRLLSVDFSVLILIAFGLSIPIAYYFSSLWLDNFAYKTEIGITVFVLVGFSSLFIALLTVSYHTVRAAIANPVKALHTE